jgi:predicted CoA-binding protein
MTLADYLTPPKTIAIIGLSDKPERPSYSVASYLIEAGFTIIPVNPMIQSFLGIPAYASLSAIPKDVHIDVVDIFRKSEEVPAIVTEVISLGHSPLIWMQEGVISEEAKKLAEDHGLPVIMNACMMKLHKKAIE